MVHRMANVLLVGTRREGSDGVYEGGITSGRSPFYIKVDPTGWREDESQSMQSNVKLSYYCRLINSTYPSRTASPKGRISDDPPKKVFQIVFANSIPWSSDSKPTEPVAPPRLSVTSLPFDWQLVTSLARAEQSGRFVPGNVVLSVGLHVYVVGSNPVVAEKETYRHSPSS